MLLQQGHEGEPFEASGAGKGVIGNEVSMKFGSKPKADIAILTITVSHDSFVLLNPILIIEAQITAITETMSC